MDPNPSLILAAELKRAAACNSFEIIPTNKSEEQESTNEVTQTRMQMQTRTRSRPGSMQAQDFIVKPKRIMAAARNRKRTNSLFSGPSPESLVVVGTIGRLLPLALVLLVISQLDLIRMVSGGGHMGANRTQTGEFTNRQG